METRILNSFASHQAASGGNYFQKLHIFDGNSHFKLQEAPRMHSGGTQEAPRRHPGGTQRHPGGSRRLQEAPGGSKGKKWYTSQLKSICSSKSIKKHRVCLTFLRFCIDFYKEFGRLLARLVARTVPRPSTKTARTPTDKSVWGIIGVSMRFTRNICKTNMLARTAC